MVRIYKKNYSSSLLYFLSLIKVLPFLLMIVQANIQSVGKDDWMNLRKLKLADTILYQENQIINDLIL